MENLQRMWVFYAPQDKNKMGRMSRWEVELNMALTAKQKKLPKALQQAILKRQKSKGMKKKKKRGKKKRSRG